MSPWSVTAYRSTSACLHDGVETADQAGGSLGGSLAEMHQHQLARGIHHEVLALVAMAGEAAGQRRPEPPVAAVVEAVVVVVSGPGTRVIEPPDGEDATASAEVGDAVVAVQLTEPGEVPGGGVHVRRPHEVAGAVELRLGRRHAARVEQTLTQESVDGRLALDGVASRAATH